MYTKIRRYDLSWNKLYFIFKQIYFVLTLLSTICPLFPNFSKSLFFGSIVLITFIKICIFLVASSRIEFSVDPPRRLSTRRLRFIRPRVNSDSRRLAQRLIRDDVKHVVTTNIDLSFRPTICQTTTLSHAMFDMHKSTLTTDW